MKRNVGVIGLGVLLASLLLSGQVIAQNLDIYVYAYTVPFDFRAGTANFAAGKYVVRVLSPSKGIICIESMKGDQRVMFLATPFSQSKKSVTTRLVFKQYEDSYFLTKVWNRESSVGLQLPTSGAEKEFIRQASVPKIIELALSRK